ncbi:MAG: MFS transporter [Xanthobacteraceae bacterium]
MSLAARHNEGADSAYAWLRLVAAILLATIGGVGMWSFPVALPAIQADFSIIRADASLPFTLAMLGFAAGGAVMGWLLDRFGILVPLTCGVVALAVGYVAAGNAVNLWWFAVAHGLIGIGSSASLGPLMADVSQWFVRRRGIAVALCSAGNYLAGVVWPPLVQHFIASAGWRPTHIGIGLFCAATMLPLAWLALRRAPPVHQIGVAAAAAARAQSTLGLSPNALMALLSIAGIACCVAMSMPQVHIVAYCGDLGYGVARGAEMLAVMMAFGIVSRIATGFIADRIGGLPTLLLGAVLQGAALFLYVLFDGLASLYVISALFGLFQGGLIPSYAIIIREYFSPQEAGTRVGVVLMATLLGMALGGWMSGAIFDLAGSYRAAFANGLAWNLVTIAVALWLIARPGRRVAPA